MRKLTKPSPTASPLLFELDAEPLPETLTALGGIPLVVQAFRSLGLPGSVAEHVRVKQRERGYDEAPLVESFVLLNAAGGESPEDFERLRGDPGLAEMTGHDLPSPRLAGRDRLYSGRDGTLGGVGESEPGLAAALRGPRLRPAPRHRGSGRDDH